MENGPLVYEQKQLPFVPTLPGIPLILHHNESKEAEA